MDDPDREGQVEAILKRQVIDSRLHDLHPREGFQIATRTLERPLVDIDRDTSGCTVCERPIAVPAHAAADIEKILALPIPRLQRCRPPAELLLMLGQNFSIEIPLVAETVGRTLEIATCVPGHSRAQL